MDYSDYEERPRTGAFKSRKKKPKCGTKYRHRWVYTEGECDWRVPSYVRWFPEYYGIFYRWNCCCFKQCKHCMSVGRVRKCLNHEFKELLRPEGVETE